MVKRIIFCLETARLSLSTCDHPLTPCVDFRLGPVPWNDQWNLSWQLVSRNFKYVCMVWFCSLSFSYPLRNKPCVNWIRLVGLSWTFPAVGRQASLSSAEPTYLWKSEQKQKLVASCLVSELFSISAVGLD